MLINDSEYMKIRNEAFEYIRNAQYTAMVNTNYALLVRNFNIGKIKKLQNREIGLDMHLCEWYYNINTSKNARNGVTEIEHKYGCASRKDGRKTNQFGRNGKEDRS